MRHFLLALTLVVECLASRAAAAAVGPLEGIYVAHMPETASALRLLPGGRFQWFFSQGALDLTGEGRWARRDERTLLLTSDPPVVPPRFTLLGRSRDDQPGVLVKVVGKSGGPANRLDLRAERASGERVDGFIQEGGAYRFEAKAGDPITGLFLGSAVFDFISERYPAAAAEANVMSFRFDPNDVGKQSFQAYAVAVEAKALELTWKGLRLRYSIEE